MSLMVPETTGSRYPVRGVYVDSGAAAPYATHSLRAIVSVLIKRRSGTTAAGGGTEPCEAPATDVESDARCHISAGVTAWKMREDRGAA